jgi:hypothetical protein
LYRWPFGFINLKQGIYAFCLKSCLRETMSVDRWKPEQGKHVGGHEGSANPLVSERRNRWVYMASNAARFFLYSIPLIWHA